MAEQQILRDALLDTEAAAAYLTLSPRTLEKWRKEGNGGPEFVKLGRRTVRYLTSALDAYIAANACASTAEGSETSRYLRGQTIKNTLEGDRYPIRRQGGRR